MKIIVLIKQVPDTWGDRRIDTSTGRVDRESGEQVIDEINERALEQALLYKDANKDAEVIVLSMGPERANDALRKCLSMGADSAIHVVDDALAGADAVRTSAVLAAALAGETYDLVLAGNISTDGRGGWLPAMLAERLGIPALPSVDSFEIAGDRITAQRITEGAAMKLSATLPAVVSVTEATPEARFPSFKGIMGAKKKPLQAKSLGDLGVTEPAAHSVVLTASERPPRTAGTVITDDGTAGRQLADFLASERLI